MNKYKFLPAIILTVIIFITFTACDKCKNEDPRARIINNSSDTAKIQVVANGQTVYLDVVDPGTYTAYNNYEAGENSITINMPKLLS